MTIDVTVHVDTTDAQRELDQLQQHADLTLKTVVSTTRKAYSSMLLMADIMGVAIPEFFSLIGTAVLMSASVIQELAAVEGGIGAITGNPLLIARAAFTFSLSIMLINRAMLLEQQKTEVESKLNSTIALLNLWS